jgi:hypothetical protein
MTVLSLSRRLWLVCSALLLATPLRAQPVASTTASNMPPPGMARIWWYRALEPYSSLATPYVRLNGAIAGVSQPGGAFYVDVPPGHYHMSADTVGVDFGQTKDVDLMPGMQIFAKIVSNDNWISGGGGGRGGGGGGYRRDTFYVWLYPVEQAWPVIAQGYFYGGGPLYAGQTAIVLPPR